MRQACRAGQLDAPVIGNLEDNPLRTCDAAGNVGIVDESRALREGLRSGRRAETAEKSRDKAAGQTQAWET